MKKTKIKKTKTTAEKASKSPDSKVTKKFDTSEGGVIWTVWHYMMAILLIVLGVLAIVYNEKLDVQRGFLIIIGSLILFDGCLRVLVNLLPVFSASNKKALNYNFAIAGAVELAVGITTIMLRVDLAQNITKFVSTFFALLCIIGGVVMLLFSIGFIVSKLYKLYLPILEIILAACLIALGIVIIIYMNKSDVFNRIVLILTGILIILGGVGELISTTVALKEHNKKAKEKKLATATVSSTASTETKPTKTFDAKHKKHTFGHHKEKLEPIDNPKSEQPKLIDQHNKLELKEPSEDKEVEKEDTEKNEIVDQKADSKSEKEKPEEKVEPKEEKESEEKETAE